MIGGQEFILVYNELFNSLHEKYGREGPVKLWKKISDDSDYIKSIEAVDNQMGKIFNNLTDTVVIITSDNGLMIKNKGDFYGKKKVITNHRMTHISPHLFRIPLVKGVIE